MDKKLRETTSLGVEIMNSKRQVKRKLGHVVQFGVNLMLNLSIDKIVRSWESVSFFYFLFKLMPVMHFKQSNVFTLTL